MSCDVGEVTESLEQSSFSNFVTSPTSQLILQPFRRFTYVTAHSQTLPLLVLRHSSFSKPFASLTLQALHLCPLANCQCRFSNLPVTSPTTQLIFQPFRRFTTSQIILQPFRRFTYVATHSPTLPLLLLRHSSFSNPYFASVASPALHLRHLASRP